MEQWTYIHFLFSGLLGTTILPYLNSDWGKYLPASFALWGLATKVVQSGCLQVLMDVLSGNRRYMDLQSCLTIRDRFICCVFF